VFEFHMTAKTYTNIYSLVYSHTHGRHAHCTWWQNVNVIEGAERGTNCFTFFLLRTPSRGQIVTHSSLHNRYFEFKLYHYQQQEQQINKVIHACSWTKKIILAPWMFVIIKLFRKYHGLIYVHSTSFKFRREFGQLSYFFCSEKLSM